MKCTCLHELHVQQGALMAPFAGYDMPIQYDSIEQEHKAVRTACGVFDVSHMGEVIVTGTAATEFVNYIFTNDVAPLADGGILYGMMLHPHGGTVDDLLVYKYDSRHYLLVINASNIDKDVAWIEKCAADFDVTVRNASDEYAELALQGPHAESCLKNVLDIDGSDLGFYTFKELTAPDGTVVLVSRTGYTGEDGFEIYAPAEYIVKAWKKLMDAGVQPCGLGCRDTLRFEAGLPLYGDELTDEISPVEAALSMFVKLDKDRFVGRQACADQKANGVSRKIVGLEVMGQAIPRHGYEVLAADSDTVVGHITTGYRSITLERNLAMALVDAPYTALGTPLRVRVRRKIFDAVVIKKRFYTPNYKK